MKKCGYCGKPLPLGMGPRKAFCGRSCGDKSRRARVRAIVEAWKGRIIGLEGKRTRVNLGRLD